MKFIGAIGTAVLSLTLAAPAYAQEQQEQHDKQEEQKEKPAPAEKRAQPDKAQPGKAQPGKTEAEKAQPEKQPRAQQAKPAKAVQHAGGGRIPDDRYKANFGREHSFRVSAGDYHNHRFQYGGYWFGFVDPWPSNWLYTQNVYVIDIGGVYYLCNPTYPGVNVAISVNL